MDKYITTLDCEHDPRFGLQIKHIVTGNDGDICNAYATYKIINGTEPKYCIDIGVDEGWWSLFVAEINPNSIIDSFEPNELSYNNFKSYLVNQNQIRLHNLAISDKDGVLSFVQEGGQSNSRNQDAKLTVNCACIDKYIKDKIVNLIKIDTEGHDLVILKSFHPFLNQIEAIIFEFTVYWYGKNKEECIISSIEELIYLKSHYKYMYIMSRRGNPVLREIKNNKDIITYVNYFYQNNHQVDILVTQVSMVPQDINVD